MSRLVALLLAVLFAGTAFPQAISNPSNPTSNPNQINVTTGWLYLNKMHFAGAWSASATYSSQDVVTSGGSTYVSLQTGNLNIAPGSNILWWTSLGGGGGGAATWGGISGTLSAQTDLATALAGKEPSISAGTAATYWRGDKTQQNLAAAIWAQLSGVSPITFNASTGAFSCPSCITANLISSVFGRAGVVVAANGDYTTAQVTESGNLYFTNTRAQSAMAGLYEFPLTFNAPLSRSTNAISCLTATGSIAGCLSAADWSAFAGKPAKFFGTTVPGSVAGNLPGDFYSDTTHGTLYMCGAVSGTAAPACTSVGVNGWSQVALGALPNTVVTATDANGNLTGASTTGSGSVVVLKNSPALTGTPTAPTAAPATGGNQIATQAYGDASATAAAALRQAALGFTPENSANKDVGSGYPGLNAGGFLKTAEFPAFLGDCTTSSGGVTIACGTAIARTGTDINTSNQVTATHLSAPLPVAQGGSGTTTPGIVAGSNISVSGTWPNQTVNSNYAMGVPLTSQTDVLSNATLTTEQAFSGKFTSLGAATSTTVDGVHKAIILNSGWDEVQAVTPVTGTFRIRAGGTSGCLVWAGAANAPATRYGDGQGILIVADGVTAGTFNVFQVGRSSAYTAVYTVGSSHVACGSAVTAGAWTLGPTIQFATATAGTAQCGSVSTSGSVCLLAGAQTADFK